MSAALTARQQAMLDYITRYLREHGYSPSGREICAEVSITSLAVMWHNVHRLVALGHLTQRPGHARSLRLPAETQPAPADAAQCLTLIRAALTGASRVDALVRATADSGALLVRWPNDTAAFYIYAMRISDVAPGENQAA